MTANLSYQTDPEVTGADGTVIASQRGMTQSKPDTEIFTTSFRIPVDLLERIKALADADDRSINYVLVKAAQEYADRHTPQDLKRAK